MTQTSPRRGRIDLALIQRVKTLELINQFFPDIMQRIKLFYSEMFPPKNTRMTKPDSRENYLLRRLRQCKTGEERLEPGLRMLKEFRQYAMSNVQTGFDAIEEIRGVNAIHGLILALEDVFRLNCGRDYYIWRLLEITQLHNVCIQFYNTLHTHFRANRTVTTPKFPPKYKFYMGNFIPSVSMTEPQPALFNPSSAEFVPPVTPPRT